MNHAQDTEKLRTSANNSDQGQISEKKKIFLKMHCPTNFRYTVVAEIITELVKFEPEIGICNGNEFDFEGEYVSVMSDFLLTFPQICLCNGSWLFWQHDSVSVIGTNCPQEDVCDIAVCHLFPSRH